MKTIQTRHGAGVFVLFHKKLHQECSSQRREESLWTECLEKSGVSRTDIVKPDWRYTSNADLKSCPRCRKTAPCASYVKEAQANDWS